MNTIILDQYGDRDVKRFLALFTISSHRRGGRIWKVRRSDLRTSKRNISLEATKIAHGEEEAEKARDGRELFLEKDHPHFPKRGKAHEEDSIPTTFTNREEIGTRNCNI